MLYEYLLAARGGMRVRRFHTRDLIVGETVGHHSCGVALIAAKLTKYPSAQLLLACLCHDLAEQYTGDTPATAKWASPALKSALDELEGRYEFMDFSILTKKERRVLKQADMLDLCFKCIEEVKLGNIDMKAILQNGIDFLEKNDPLPVTVTLLEGLKNECK